jgi:hypothetical protein
MTKTMISSTPSTLIFSHVPSSLSVRYAVFSLLLLFKVTRMVGARVCMNLQTSNMVVDRAGGDAELQQIQNAVQVQRDTLLQRPEFSLICRFVKGRLFPVCMVSENKHFVVCTYGTGTSNQAFICQYNRFKCRLNAHMRLRLPQNFEAGPYEFFTSGVRQWYSKVIRPGQVGVMMGRQHYSEPSIQQLHRICTQDRLGVPRQTTWRCNHRETGDHSSEDSWLQCTPDRCCMLETHYTQVVDAHAQNA